MGIHATNLHLGKKTSAFFLHLLRRAPLAKVWPRVCSEPSPEAEKNASNDEQLETVRRNKHNFQKQIPVVFVLPAQSGYWRLRWSLPLQTWCRIGVRYSGRWGGDGVDRATSVKEMEGGGWTITPKHSCGQNDDFSTRHKRSTKKLFTPANRPKMSFCAEVF